MDLRGKRILVMGLGVHGGGLGVARFLVSAGADVTVTDMRGPDALRATLDALEGLPIRYVLGEHREDDFRNAEIVVRNPGVPRESRFLQIAREAGAQIEMEMTLFFRLCPGPIIGITGTKGKTTTTMLTGAMFKEQFPDTVIAGNLRVSALEQLPKITPTTPVVLELSSFVLEGLGEAKLSPQYACITNISEDHLDRYETMDEYIWAKRQIYWWQNDEDVLVVHLEPTLAHHTHFFDETHRQRGGRVICFTEHSLEDFSDWPFADEALITIQHNSEVHWNSWDGIYGDIVPRSDKPSALADLGMPLFNISDVQLPGEHNLLNVMAAAALAKAYGVSNENIRNAIRKFKGVPDRLELVRELDGVRYINDTTATAPEAAIAALHSFDAPIVLVAGGADKNLPFDALAQTIRERAKAVVLLQGTATEKLLAALEATSDQGVLTNDQHIASSADTFVVGHSSFIVGPYSDFAQAIGAARELAVPGDIVLLSPGCASFGMFKNEFHRGEEFRRIVNTL